MFICSWLTICVISFDFLKLQLAQDLAEHNWGVSCGVSVPTCAM